LIRFPGCTGFPPPSCPNGWVRLRVKKFLKAVFRNAEIVGAGKRNRNGKVTLKLNLRDNGQNIDGIVTPEGINPDHSENRKRCRY